MEVAVAYVIASLAVVALMTVHVLTIKANSTSEATLIASQLAAELLEEVKLRKWDEAQWDLRPAYPSVTVSAIGTDAGESSTDKTTFDDIDDFDGWSEQPPKDPVGRSLTDFPLYKRTVTVKFVTSSLADSASATPYKLVEVCANRKNVTSACIKWLATNL